MTRFQFVAHKKIWFTIAAILMVLSFSVLMFKGLNFSLEFTGGTSITWQFDKPVTVEQVRAQMAKYDLGGSKSVIQPVGDAKDNTVLIRTESLRVSTQDAAIPGSESTFTQDTVLKGIQKDLGGERVSVLNVGPAWGAQVTQSALIALFLSFLAVFIYIALRFEYKMGAAALLSLAHDMAIAVGIYALVGREVSPATIAAFLTVLGYSLYDTIVVFHRVLENSRKLGKETYSTMVNTSVNQVLVRSMNTSFSTLVPVIAIMLFGGETLKDFAFALLVGFIPGTYSSIFLATPFLAWWKEREPRYAALRRKVAAMESGEERPRYKRKAAADKAAEGTTGVATAEAESTDVSEGGEETKPATPQAAKPKARKPKKKKR